MVVVGDIFLLIYLYTSSFPGIHVCRGLSMIYSSTNLCSIILSSFVYAFEIYFGEIPVKKFPNHVFTKEMDKRHVVEPLRDAFMHKYCWCSGHLIRIEQTLEDQSALLIHIAIIYPLMGSST